MDNLLIAFLIESSIGDHGSMFSNKISRKKPMAGTVGEAKHDRNLITVSREETEATTGGHSTKLCVYIGFKHEYLQWKGERKDTEFVICQ